MPVTITNLQRSGPLHVPLASGRTVRLSPGETSQPITDVEVDANPRVDKLVGRGLVEVTPIDLGSVEDDEERSSGGGTRGAGRRGGRASSRGADAQAGPSDVPSDE